MSASIDLSKLNEGQLKIATTLDEPLFVEAGAGSGKTSTLTKRVAWALAPGSGPDGRPFLDDLSQVLVITFTNAAAREIKDRVRSELRSAGMVEAALAVDEAWISTIHAMCRRILARHALDLGLDPSFSVVGESSQHTLFDAALDGVMREARADRAFAPVFDEFELGTLSLNGYTDVLGFVEGLVKKGRALPGGFDALAPAPFDPCTLEEAVRDLMMRMEELWSCKLSDNAREKVAAALEVLRALEGRRVSAMAPEELSAVLDSVKLPQARGEIKEAVNAVRSALTIAQHEGPFQRVAPAADLLLELARRVNDRYDELKRAQSCLDNDDLIHLALHAVRDCEEVRRAYAGRFRLVMVDEFQDTDEAQLELIGLLSGEGAHHLCTVGDAQQSIYRFRGADVSVFRGRGASVGRENVVRLDTNYRSHADVLALVERVCAGVGPVRGTMPDFMHLDSCPTRKDKYVARSLPRVDVEVCAGTASGGYPTRYQTATMAVQVADALARYRDAGESPGDMALLLGATTNSATYIDAIRARGMECVVTGGSTFVDTDEARIVCALLHALANPRDTQSGLFPLLASEVFGLDANDFCELGTRAQDKLDAPTKRAIDRGLLDMTFFHAHEPSARLKRAHEVLARALDEVRWRPVADVCADVVRDAGWLARLEACGPEGVARAANVLAAVRYVRDLTSELGLGAARAATEFDLWLKKAKVSPASLAGGEGGPVRVMTIHASKGLEFGVCAVAECWSNPRLKEKMVYGPSVDGGQFFVLPPADVTENSLSNIDPEELEQSADRSAVMPLAARYRAYKEKSREQEAQEKTRLLYVALTRAREALIVGIAGASSKKSGVSSHLAADALNALGAGEWDPAPGVRALAYGGSEPARLRCVVVEKHDDEMVADSAGTLPGFDGPLPDDPAKLARWGLDEDDAGAGGAAFGLYEMDEATRCPAPTTWRAREGVFSYSSVHAALAQPAERPPAPSPAVREAEAAGAPVTEDVDRATNLGSAFHELAQAMVESGGPVDDARIASQVRRWNLSERAEGRLRAALARWEGSSLRAEALSWPSVRPEVPFFQRVDSPHGDHLEGAIDLLCVDPAARRALVVDYKTGDAGLSRDEVRERHAMQAEFYAGVLLAEGLGRVECAFVCVERDDPDAPGEPLVVRYEFGA